RWYRSSYGSMSGTSMAAPHVTGVAAAIWSAFPDLTGPQVKAAICNTASGTYSYASSNIPYYEGYGMLDAYAAMKMASAWSGDSFPAQVSLGAYDTAVLKADGSLWMWGYGAEGQMGNGKTWMENTTPVKVMDDVAQVSVGEYHCAAIKKDGTLWMWGSNDRGQLGDGSYRNRATPVKIMDDVTQVSLGAYHSAAIKKDGSLWTWGDNVGPAGINWGLLGNADTETRAKPAKLMDDVVQVSLGDAHPAAIKKDGSLWMWGANREGQLGDGSKDDHSSPTFIMYLFG
ncbi:MAG: S8 family serine peptidase, partial [Coriobacteriales bacterium]|nr:S8 family serine peptidase [Coriobacteriales bacterium]